jgi:hypothetical protein
MDWEGYVRSDRGAANAFPERSQDIWPPGLKSNPRGTGQKTGAKHIINLNSTETISI